MDRPPNLAEAFAILGSISGVEADFSAQDPEQPEFEVRLRFSRAQLRSKGAGEFAELPVPIWLLTALVGFLQRLIQQENKEAAWSTKQSPGATLADCLAFIRGQIMREKNDIAGMYTKKLYGKVELYLQELVERRSAGGFTNPHQARQDQDSAKWRFEDSPAAEELRKEQARTRRKMNGTADFTAGGWTATEQRIFEEYFSRSFGKGAFDETILGGAFRGAREHHQQYQNETPEIPAPQPFSGPKWWQVLGVKPSATKDEIKKQARQLTKQYHPDRNKSVDAVATMAAINSARDEGLAGARA